MGILDDTLHFPQEMMGKGVDALWQSLPPEVRASWRSGARTLPQILAELSPGAAVRDVVDESGNMAKAAQSGNWMGAGSGPAKMATALASIVPVGKVAKALGMTTRTAQETLAPAIRAYHGSPHDFDRWDFSRGRTGEGGNAFGVGGYFADNPEVARSYRDVLENKPTGPGSPNLNTPEWLARSVLDATGGDPAKALAELDRRIADIRARDPRYVSAGALERFSAARDVVAQGKSPGGGKMYEVDIHADPAKFIDYDKPLAEQSDLVKQALALRQTNTSIGGGPKLYSESTGMYVPDKPNVPAGQVLPVKDPASVAAMEQAGVPGVKYLDANSRRPTWANLLPKDALPQQPQTSNYVVFPTQKEIIEILRKYGMLPVAAGGAAATVPSLLADDQGGYE